MKKPTIMDNEKKIEGRELIRMLLDSLVENVAFLNTWEENYWIERRKNSLSGFNPYQLEQENHRQEKIDMLRLLEKGVSRYLEDDTVANSVVNSVKLMLDEAKASKEERKVVEALISKFEKKYAKK